jgi:opacity protein-like surface antigen
MKTLIIATAAVAALAIGSAATAQEVGKVYGSVGYSQTDNDKTDTDLGSINARVGTKITPHFGVEGEAAFGTDSDKVGGAKYKLTNKAAVYGVGYLPVSKSFDLVGRVGVSDTDLKAPAAAGKYEQGTALEYGVGGQYHINPNYAIRADYTRSDFQSDKGNADTATLSLVKQF